MLPRWVLICGAAKPGEILQLFFDCSNRFNPKPYKLDPNPYTQ